MFDTKEYLQIQIADAVLLYRKRFTRRLAETAKYVEVSEAINALVDDFKKVDKKTLGEFDKILDPLFIAHPILKLIFSSFRFGLTEDPSITEATKPETKKTDAHKSSTGTAKPQPKAESSHKSEAYQAEPNEEVDSNLGKLQWVASPTEIEAQEKQETKEKAAEMKAKYVFFGTKEFVEKLAQYIDGLFKKTYDLYNVTLTEKFKRDVCNFIVCNLVVLFEEEEKTISTSEFKVDEIISQILNISGETEKKIDKMRGHYPRGAQNRWLGFYNESTTINDIPINVIEYVGKEGQVNLNELSLPVTEEMKILNKISEQIEAVKIKRELKKESPTMVTSLTNMGKRAYNWMTDESSKEKEQKIIFFLKVLQNSWEQKLTRPIFDQLREETGEKVLEHSVSKSYTLGLFGVTSGTSKITSEIKNKVDIKTGNEFSVFQTNNYYKSSKGSLISLKEEIEMIFTEKELPEGFMLALDREIKKRKDIISEKQTTQDRAVTVIGAIGTPVSLVVNPTAVPEEARKIGQAEASLGESSSANGDNAVERKYPDNPTERLGLSLS